MNINTFQTGMPPRSVNTTEYPIENLYLTNAGAELARTDLGSAAINSFIGISHTLSSDFQQFRQFDTIAVGQRSIIVELPGDEGKCIKVVPQDAELHYPPDKAIRQITEDVEKHYPIEPPKKTRVPNLVPETRFMHRIDRVLQSSPDSGVMAPTQYAAVRFTNGAAILQDRIPDEFMRLRDTFMGSVFGRVDQEYIRDAGIVLGRLHKALGSSVLRFGIDRSFSEETSESHGNVFIEKDKGPHQTKIYVIGLLTKKMPRRALATLLA